MAVLGGVARGRVVRVGVSVALTGVAVLAAPASAGVASRAGVAGAVVAGTGVGRGLSAGMPRAGGTQPTLFTCWEAPVRVTITGGPHATPDKQSCVDTTAGDMSRVDTAGPVGLTIVGARGVTRVSGAANGSTTQVRTASAWTRAVVAGVRIVSGTTVLEFGPVASRASIRCTYGPDRAQFAYTARSELSSVRVNGRPLHVPAGDSTVPLPGVGTLGLNRSTVSGFGVVRYAAVLHTPAADVVIGEAAVGVADTAANPCRP
jgi:hypothetical protein